MGNCMYLVPTRNRLFFLKWPRRSQIGSRSPKTEEVDSANAPQEAACEAEALEDPCTGADSIHTWVASTRILPPFLRTVHGGLEETGRKASNIGQNTPITAERGLYVTRRVRAFL